MRGILFLLGFTGSLVFSITGLAKGDFPTGPDLSLTPGSLCQSADEIRYPEKISYCRRDVSTGTKRQIIKEYDEELGYRVGSLNRQDFKIDHYIPLCAGGSNSRNNLWPQHESVFNVTDPLEQLMCEKMADGVLAQKEAVDLIREAKADLSTVPGIIEHLRAL